MPRNSLISDFWNLFGQRNFFEPGTSFWQRANGAYYSFSRFQQVSTPSTKISSTCYRLLAVVLRTEVKKTPEENQPYVERILVTLREESSSRGKEPCSRRKSLTEKIRRT